MTPACRLLTSAAEGRWVPCSSEIKKQIPLLSRGVSSPKELWETHNYHLNASSIEVLGYSCSGSVFGKPALQAEPFTAPALSERPPVAGDEGNNSSAANRKVSCTCPMIEESRDFAIPYAVR